jgi:hypothetical protein
MGSSLLPKSMLSGLTTAGALLTCFAVVLNPFPLTKTTKPEAVRAINGPAIATTSNAIPQTSTASEPERVRSIVQTAEISAPVRTFEEPSSAPDFGSTPTLAAQAQAAIAGVWTPDASACSVRNFRDGVLPTLINTHGAWAGGTFCIFSNQKQTQTSWDVVANCSNAREHWTTRVRLTIKGDRLVWASKRGTQAYTRCPPDFLLAEAPQ